MEADGPCVCPEHAPKPQRALTPLLLECWLREHDCRPYQTLLLSRKLFEKTYHRQLNADDYRVITNFLKTGKIDNFEIVYMPMLPLQVSESMLRILSKLTHVSLCSVDMQVDHLKTLLEGECTFISLRLSGNVFTREHADVLRDFLLVNQTVAYLDVGYCSLDHITFAIVADGMLQCSSLRAIDLSRIIPCYPLHVPDASKLAVIVSMLIWPNRLYEVHAKHMKLDGHDIVPIVECLDRCANLVYLDLGSNCLGAHGAKIIFEALKATPHLIGLDISNNNLGEHGGLEIATKMPFTRIRFLDIGHNAISAHAMEMILLTLKKASPLRICNMVGNCGNFDVGKVLRRVLDARVLMLNAVDMKTTYDADTKTFRIVPLASERARYNYRYFRGHPFIRRYDVAPNLLWHEVNKRTLVVNCLFIDVIFVDVDSNVYTFDAQGKRAPTESTRVFNF